MLIISPYNSYIIQCEPETKKVFLKQNPRKRKKSILLSSLLLLLYLSFVGTKNIKNKVSVLQFCCCFVFVFPSPCGKPLMAAMKKDPYFLVSFVSFLLLCLSTCSLSSQPRNPEGSTKKKIFFKKNFNFLWVSESFKIYVFFG